ncbi:MAG: UvrD-helicase domain-containing protein, partial [Spirochaetaceae bacterium]|nr:UvrD-helicase domain-containing protein [Spirochaetaceae bacterium]
MTQDYLSVLNPEQLEAVTHTGSPLLILAGAGSGKTRVITTKIAYLIDEQNIEPWKILAVTFTKKAATEMRERAEKLCERAVKSQIKTFHSFGAWLLRLYGNFAGIDSNFTVYDDDDMVSLLVKAAPQLSKQQA